MSGRDDEEFEEFVVARSGQLRRVAFLVVGDWQHAEDVVQTALANLYVAWPRVRRREAVDAYARRAVVNAAISWTRKKRPEVLTAEMADRTGPVAASYDRELVEALRQLTPAQAAVVALRFLEDMSVSDVAATLGISEGTVKSQTSRALAGLRLILTQPESSQSQEQR
jgi:RNA polymerase sigma-70 factor (sigma-E family)